MFQWKRSSIGRWIAVVSLVVAVSGCATQRIARKGEHAGEHGNWDAAVYHYLEALAEDPGNVEYKMALTRARQKAGQQHFQRGETYHHLGNLTAARSELQMAVELDPTHQFAQQELEAVTEELAILSRPDGEQTLEELKRKAREAKVQPPLLDPQSEEPITLTFPRPTDIKEIYRAIGKAFGFNVMFDPDLADDKISVDLNDVTAERALETVMQGAGHFYKVLDKHTILVAEDTPQKRRDYEDLVIKTFFLSNAEVKDVDKLLRSLIEARRVATNEQLNAISLRDTADKVAIAEQLITTNDKAKAEVLVDVELMEVNSTKMRELGLKLSSYAFALGLDVSEVGDEDDDTPAPTGTALGLDQLSQISRGDWTVSVPKVTLNLIKNSTEAVSLAQPQLRITEGEKASLVIGERTPVPVTSFNTANTVGSNVLPITSYQYQDVGITIEVEPRVHHNREITLTIKVEVSQVNGYQENQPIIGTRTINTVIRLKDGETNMLVGLYKEDSSTTKAGVPGLGDLPLVGRLFSNRSKQQQTTDLVLTLTPHIIRFPDIDEADLAPLWVGTQSRMSFFGNSPRVHSGRGAEGPFDEEAPRNPWAEREEERADEPSRGTARPGPVHRKRPVPRSLRASPGGDTGSRPTPGVDLAGSGKGVESATSGLEGARQSSEAHQPVLVALEPSLVSVPIGQTVELRLYAGGAAGTTVPLEVGFDPNRLRVEDVVAGPGATEVSTERTLGSGSLAVNVIAADDAGAAVVLTVRGVGDGPAEVTVKANGATLSTGGGSRPVVASGSSIYVVNGGE